jgi:hypothetical protein
MKITMKKLRKLAEENGKRLIYNRSTGLYQITSGFISSEGEMPARNESGKLVLNEKQLKKLESYI